MNTKFIFSLIICLLISYAIFIILHPLCGCKKVAKNSEDIMPDYKKTPREMMEPRNIDDMNDHLPLPVLG